MGTGAASTPPPSHQSHKPPPQPSWLARLHFDPPVPASLGYFLPQNSLRPPDTPALRSPVSPIESPSAINAPGSSTLCPTRRRRPPAPDTPDWGLPPENLARSRSQSGCLRDEQPSWPRGLASQVPAAYLRLVFPDRSTADQSARTNATPRRMRSQA
jgi:hypothetical protein